MSLPHFFWIFFFLFSNFSLNASVISSQFLQDKFLTFAQPIVDHVVHLNLQTIQQHSRYMGTSELMDHQELELLKKQWEGMLVSKPGGSASNTLKGLAALGHNCLVVGCIGDDPWGSYYQHEMEQKGVQTDLKRLQKPTAQLLSMVDPQGKRTMRVSIGAAKELKEGDIREEHFKQAGVVHLEGYHIRNVFFLEAAMKKAKERGCLVSLDLGSFQLVEEHKEAFTHLIQTYVDILFGNFDESHALVQANEGDEIALALNQWAGIVAVHNGDEGYWVAQDNQVKFYPAYKAESVVDTTGAGDLFISGFLHGYASGKSLEYSSQFAGLLGTLAVQIEGGELPNEVWEKLRHEYVYKESKLPSYKKSLSLDWKNHL